MFSVPKTLIDATTTELTGPTCPPPRQLVPPRPRDHVGSHSRYSAGCRCAACTRAHAFYLCDWRAGRIEARVDAAPVRAHLQRLVDSGLILAHLADEARVPRRTVYGLWRRSHHTTHRRTADALLALRPLEIEALLPARVVLADRADGRSKRRSAVEGLDLRRGGAARIANALGVSVRTVERWRALQTRGRTA